MRIMFGSYTDDENTDGVRIAEFGETNGSLVYEKSLFAGLNPSWIEWDQESRTLFCVNETGTADGIGGSVTAIKLQGYQVLKITTIAIPGAGPCHLSLDRVKKRIFTADYTSGTITRVELDADLMPLSSEVFVRHLGLSRRSDRQDSAHVHSVYIKPEGLWCCDLGIDRIRIYDPDSSKLKLEIKTPDGSGPRMMLWLSEDFFYIVAELSNRIIAYKRNAGAWMLVGEWSTSDPSNSLSNTASHALWNEKAGCIYVANRGQNNLAVFYIKAGGELQLHNHVQLSINWPRHFMLSQDGEFLIVAGQTSHDLEILHLNKKGLPQASEVFSNYPSPTCLIALTDFY